MNRSRWSIKYLNQTPGRHTWYNAYINNWREIMADENNNGEIHPDELETMGRGEEGEE